MTASESVEAWVPEAPPGPSAPPDLLIVNYRLPAIVVTGSSMVGHEEEAGEHDFHLLLKPVLPNKLRAMIGFKLGVR